MPTNLSANRALLLVAVTVAVVLPRPVDASGAEPEAQSPPRLRLALEIVTGQPLGMTGIEIVPESFDALWVLDELVIDRFPLPERRAVSLELRRVPLLRPDARFVTVDETGEHSVPAPDVRFFQGRIEGVDDSSVVLMAHGGRVSGSLRAFGESFGFGPRWPRATAPGAAGLRVWNHELEGAGPATACETDAVPERTGRTHARVEKSVEVDADDLIEATLAVDATVQWYERLGSIEAAQAMILDLLHQSSAIYEQEVAVRLTVGYVRIFTAEPDPYDGTGGTMALLGQLRTEWNANMTQIDRALVHLFDVQASGGAGRAFVDVLCDSSDRPGASADYGLSRIQADGRVWELRMVAHELGHGFSSQHTHCYQPEIDRCANANGCYAGTPETSVGTIMSYCNQYDVTFHPRVRDESIRPAAESAVDHCLTFGARPGTLSPEADASAALILDRPAHGKADEVALSWGAPCNAASVSNQDFEVYHGSLGDWNSLTPLSCSTSRLPGWSGSAPDGFFLVVPATDAHEGSYGRTSAGIERVVSDDACRPQSIGECS